MKRQMSQGTRSVISDGLSSAKKQRPVDTTEEFVNTINDQLHTAGAGIQIIMQESKDAQWFKKKQRDEEKINKMYNKVRKWEVAPETFTNTEAEVISKLASQHPKIRQSRTSGM